MLSDADAAKINSCLTFFGLKPLAIASSHQSHSSVVRVLTMPTQEKLVLKIAYNEVKFSREKFALNTLPAVVRVPTLLDSFEDKEKQIYAILMSFEKGQNADTVSLTKSDCQQIGQTLARIHTFKYNFSGELFTRSHPTTDWATYFKKLVYSYISETKDIIPTRLTDFAIKYYEQNSSLAHTEQLVFCHCDFRLANLLIDKNHLTVIDFENCRSANPLFDFTRIKREIDAKKNNLFDAFTEGYSTIHSLPDNLHESLNFFDFYQQLGAVSFCCKRGQTNSDFFYENLTNLEKYLH